MGAPMIDEATVSDIEAMLDLAAANRETSALYHPLFHRPAQNAREAQRRFFQQLVSDREFIVLVHRTDGRTDGFIVGHLVEAPPVYDPGGPTCVVDDFAVEDSKRWDDIGLAMLTELRDRAKERGAVQVIVVTAPEDEGKRRLLMAAGLRVGSEWMVGPI